MRPAGVWGRGTATPIGFFPASTGRARRGGGPCACHGVGEAAANAEQILQSARKEAENTLREAALQAKDYQLQVKLDFERETRERKNEISQLEKRLLQKEDTLDRKTAALEARAQEFGKREREIAELEHKLERGNAELKEIIREAKENLERIAGMTAERAKSELGERIADEARMGTR